MENPNFTWDDLRIAQAIAQTGSLSGASRRLALSIATVSRRLDRLEEGLGRRLFYRHASGLMPATGSEAVLEATERVAQGVGDVLRLAAQKDEPEGVVRVSTLETVVTHVIGPRLSRFCRQHPRIQLVLRSTPRVESLARSSVDIAVRMARPTEARSIGRKLGTLRYGLYATGAYLKRHGPLEGSDLRNHAVVMFEEAMDELPEMAWLAEGLGGTPPSIRVSTTAAIRAAIRSGAVMGLLPTFLATKDMRSLLPAEALPERTFWMVMHEDHRNSPAVRAVADFIIDAAKELS